MPYRDENWDALSYEQYLSKQHFLNNCCAFTLWQFNTFWHNLKIGKCEKNGRRGWESKFFKENNFLKQLFVLLSFSSGKDKLVLSMKTVT